MVIINTHDVNAGTRGSRLPMRLHLSRSKRACFSCISPVECQWKSRLSHRARASSFGSQVLSGLRLPLPNHPREITYSGGTRCLFSPPSQALITSCDKNYLLLFLSVIPVTPTMPEITTSAARLRRCFPLMSADRSFTSYAHILVFGNHLLV